jgi:hypothetical protein
MLRRKLNSCLSNIVHIARCHVGDTSSHDCTDGWHESESR